jgi:hypothetical protein
MKSFIVVFLCCLMAFPLPLLANPPESDPPRITGIKEGEPAPYDGVLLNTSAAARTFIDKEYSAKECELRINFEVQKESLRMRLLLDTTRVSLEATEKRYNSIITIKDEEIERLSQIVSDRPNDHSVWWAAGGIVVGIGLTIAVVYAVKEN